MSPGEPSTTPGDPAKTEVGSVFVSNYPPYSFWSPAEVERARAALAAAPRPGVPLGLYLHIPFCRKRCKFCYFKVYTDQNSVEVQSYLDRLAREVELQATLPVVGSRQLRFVYFGGGTPSFISARQLRGLVSRLAGALPFDAAEEVSFECEPGTLTEPKLEAIREIGVTRLSLGVENFDDAILSENGRAHTSPEIYRVMPWIKAQRFDMLNVDLIAGMIGESWETWKSTVQKTIDLDPDSVTIYQMELPYNTVYSQQILDGTGGPSVAGWELKRAWHDYAIERLAAAGYDISSAYTMVKAGKRSSFVYRDAVWHGSDMLGAGVSSFSHVSGIHFQNAANIVRYGELVDSGRLPLDRAFVTSEGERLTREMILQLKLGGLEPGYFRDKFRVDILQEFAPAFERLEQNKMLALADGRIRLTRQGLLRVDTLLPEFYAERYRNARYT